MSHSTGPAATWIQGLGRVDGSAPRSQEGGFHSGRLHSPPSPVGASIRQRYGIQADLAGKTGTTQNNTDGGFSMMSPERVNDALDQFLQHLRIP